MRIWLTTVAARCTSLLACAVLVTLCSCSVYEIPETSATRGRVMDATKQVIAERYPMSIASDDYDYVLALTPAEVEGGTTTKRQISVRLVQNYTGAYEPVVRVRHYVDMSTTSLEGDPAAHPYQANVLADHRWRPMGYLPYEEQRLREAISEKLNSMGL